MNSYEFNATLPWLHTDPILVSTANWGPPIAGTNAYQVDSISTYGHTTVMIDKDRRAYGWGENQLGSLAFPSGPAGDNLNPGPLDDAYQPTGLDVPCMPITWATGCPYPEFGAQQIFTNSENTFAIAGGSQRFVVGAGTNDHLVLGDGRVDPTGFAGRDGLSTGDPSNPTQAGGGISPIGGAGTSGWIRPVGLDSNADGVPENLLDFSLPVLQVAQSSRNTFILVDDGIGSVYCTGYFMSNGWVNDFFTPPANNTNIMTYTKIMDDVKYIAGGGGSMYCVKNDGSLHVKSLHYLYGAFGPSWSIGTGRSNWAAGNYDYTTARSHYSTLNGHQFGCGGGGCPGTWTGAQAALGTEDQHAMIGGVATEWPTIQLFPGPTHSVDTTGDGVADSDVFDPDGESVTRVWPGQGSSRPSGTPSPNSASDWVIIETLEPAHINAGGVSIPDRYRLYGWGDDYWGQLTPYSAGDGHGIRNNRTDFFQGRTHSS